MMDKRAITCRPCAESLHDAAQIQEVPVESRVGLDAITDCPFCGGPAESFPEGDRGYWRTACKAAMTCGHRGSAMPSQQDSVEAWNRRVNAPVHASFEQAIHWRCYHCNYIARTQDQALEHFGPGISERPPVCTSPPPAAQPVEPSDEFVEGFKMGAMPAEVPEGMRRDAERVDPNYPTSGKTRIPVSTVIFHDHSVYRWPENQNDGDVDPNMEFEVHMAGGSIELVAPDFGGVPYINGSILVKLFHWEEAWAKEATKTGGEQA